MLPDIVFQYQTPYGLHWISPLSQGNIFIRSGVTVDREDPSLHIDSLGHGVLTFNILAVNDAPTGTFTATATVCHVTLISCIMFAVNISLLVSVFHGITSMCMINAI